MFFVAGIGSGHGTPFTRCGWGVGGNLSICGASSDFR